MPGLRSNFPMALDERAATLAVIYRDPSQLVLLNPRTGAVIQSLETCGAREVGEIMPIVAHTAYHLGAIRHALKNLGASIKR